MFYQKSACLCVIPLILISSIQSNPAAEQESPLRRKQILSSPNYYRDPRFVFLVPIFPGALGLGKFQNGVSVNSVKPLVTGPSPGLFSSISSLNPFSGNKNVLGNKNILGNLQHALQDPCNGFLLQNVNGFRKTAVVGVCKDYFSCLLTKGKIVGLCKFGTKSCCYHEPQYMHIYTGETGFTNDKLTFTPVTTSVCQVRLDFNQFTITGPDANGVCNQGGGVTFMNEAVPPNPPDNICGDLTGQHIYLNFDSDGTPIMMMITNNLPTGSYEIKATQIECSDTENKAPAGCLQYYREPTGTIMSFNYLGGVHLANQDYNVCLGQPDSSVEWIEDAGSPVDISSSYINRYGACLTDKEDYLYFPSGRILSDNGVVNQTFTYLCGYGEDPINYGANNWFSYGSTPAMAVHFNADESFEAADKDHPDKGHTGFILSYSKKAVPLTPIG